LARAERELGAESWCVVVEPSPFAYDVDEAVVGGALDRERARWRLLRRALRDYDVVHFNFGRSLFPPRLQGRWREQPLRLPGRLYADALDMRDLPFLKRAGKVLAVTFQGDDARQATGIDSPFHRALGEQAGEGYYTPRGDALKRRAIAHWDRYADHIFYVNPDLGTFLPRRAEFVPYAHVNPDEWPFAGRPRSYPPVVVHAPSHRGIKGTQHVLAAVDELRRRGVAIDFRLVEGVDYAAARRVYEQADLLVDQVLVGWYGGLAVEFMALGKPVICHIEENFASRYAPESLVADLPILRAGTADLADVLERTLALPDNSYAEIARRTRAFAERWHDPRAIAGRTIAAYDQTVKARP
jgi:glycosyltransferase involved in cell wall biosynthesis